MNKIKSILITSVAAATMLSTTAFSADGAGFVKGSTGNLLSEVSTISGSGEFGAVNGKSLDSEFRNPQGITVASDGSVYIADTSNHLIRQVNNNEVTTYAGITLDVSDLGLPQGGISDGRKAVSVFQNPKGITADTNGNVFIADSANNTIRKIDSAGHVSTIAGNPEGIVGFANGKGQTALFNQPSDVVVAPNGTLYVADTLNHAIRSITAQGVVSTLNAESNRVVEISDGVVEAAGDFKDGKLSEALFNEPTSIVLDAKGNLYVSDTGNQLIRYIDLTTLTVTTVAGGTAALTGSELYGEADYVDGTANEAKFNFPKGLALSSEGGLFIADSQNNAVRYLFNNRVTTVAGNVTGTFGDQFGTERNSKLSNPTDVAVNSAGDLLIADSYNNKIRKVSFYKLPASLNNDGTIHVVNATTEVTFDAKPQNINGRIMVPIRAISEALGYQIQPEGSTKVTLTKGTTSIELTFGSLDVSQTIDGVVSTKKVDSAPFIQDERTYVPVRFLSELLGKQVDWSAEYKAVILR